MAFKDLSYKDTENFWSDQKLSDKNVVDPPPVHQLDASFLGRNNSNRIESGSPWDGHGKPSGSSGGPQKTISMELKRDQDPGDQNAEFHNDLIHISIPSSSRSPISMKLPTVRTAGDLGVWRRQLVDSCWFSGFNLNGIQNRSPQDGHAVVIRVTLSDSKLDVEFNSTEIIQLGHHPLIWTGTERSRRGSFLQCFIPVESGYTPRRTNCADFSMKDLKKKSRFFSRQLSKNNEGKMLSFSPKKNCSEWDGFGGTSPVIHFQIFYGE